MGDVVDTMIRTSEESTDVLTSQMPQFGISSSAVFDESPPEGSFSLAFNEGMRPLPWMAMYDNKKRPLKEISVTFVYSRSGDGTIHAVSSETTYSDAKGEGGFRVKYKWVQEEKVDLQSGMTVMFLGVCIVSIIVLLQSCNGLDASRAQDGNSATSSYEQVPYGQQAAVSSGMPKWD